MISSHQLHYFSVKLPRIKSLVVYITFVPLKKLRKGILFLQVVMRRDEGWVYSIPALEHLSLGSAAAKIGDKSLKTS
jgi:hypothetical protein